MSDQQRLHLLGPVRIAPSIDTQNETSKIALPGNDSWNIPSFRSRRGIALLGYLAAERRPVSRSFLAALFWPDEPLSKARGSLRRELYNLTQILPGCWQLDRQAAAFIPSPELSVDIYTLLTLEAQEHWIEAAGLLGGEFLEALYLENNIKFENWLTGEQDRWRWRSEIILTRVIEGFILRGQYRDALQYSQRLLQFVPWKEETHRQVMRLYTWTGQRGSALHQFDICKQTLKNELDVEPSEETVALFRQIRAGELDLPPQIPAFLTEETARHEIVPPLIVAREREMLQLTKALEKAMIGKSRVIFVSGGPGRGKTVLMQAFAQQAMGKHADLLVASGNCIAYSGIGDPYLPFRDIMAMLMGDVEIKWDTGSITREHASRLWKSFPIIAKAILEHAPNTLNVLVQADKLKELISIRELTCTDPWVSELRELINHQQISKKDSESRNLFQQTANLLQAVAEKKPLLLILDDVQWADKASISLLFHLGRRFAETNSKILILCALRPEEVFSRCEDERHPLVKLLNEFKRFFGDEWVELAQTGRRNARRFVDALLDSEKNRLGEGFRSSMLQRTAAHPLFTIELLRAMQDRGELFKDENGYWVEASNLDWNLLPARVEAVIEERINQLDSNLQEVLTVASVEGEIFTAEVVAEVQGKEEKSLLRQLSMQLEHRNRLVVEQEGIEVNGRYFSRYKFNHILFQNYFYQRICEGERRLQHAAIANAMEKLYGNQLEIVTVQLAHHLHRAGDYSRAFRYYIQAAERATRIYANDEAITHYSQAIGLISKVFPLNHSEANLYRERGRIYERQGNFDEALSDFTIALDLAKDDDDRLVKWRILIDLGKLWASRDYNLTKKYYFNALALAQDLDLPEIVAENFNWIGNWHTNADEPQKALRYHQEALLTIEKWNDPRELANTLDLLGVSHLMGGNFKESAQYYDQAINIFRELDDQSRLVSSLTGSAATYSMLALLASLSTSSSSKAISDVSEAIRISTEISSSLDQTWPYWALGLIYTVHAQFDEARKSLERGLQIATEISHYEFIVGHQFALGLFYIELFDPDQAVVYLKKSLRLARELDSRIHIYISCGLLAGAYLLQKRVEIAQLYLDEVISDQTPMDTVGKRHCWLRQAEIALTRGDPQRALDILDRLIDTAPGIETGDVITYLWMMKGEAFTHLGLFDNAITFLQSAVANAQKMEERFLLWRAHASLGKLYLATDQQRAAEQEFLTSRSIVEEIAAAFLDESMKRNFLRGAYNILSFNGDNSF